MPRLNKNTGQATLAAATWGRTSEHLQDTAKQSPLQPRPAQSAHCLLHTAIQAARCDHRTQHPARRAGGPRQVTVVSFCKRGAVIKLNAGPETSRLHQNGKIKVDAGAKVFLEPIPGFSALTLVVNVDASVGGGGAA
jgi:hypothetical protein